MELSSLIGQKCAMGVAVLRSTLLAFVADGCFS